MPKSAVGAQERRVCLQKNSDNFGRNEQWSVHHWPNGTFLRKPLWYNRQQKLRDLQGCLQLILMR